MTTVETFPAPEVGHASQVLAVTDDYAQAEAIVNMLGKHDFPVEHVRIVGDGLRFVEQVKGRLTVWGSIGRGAAGGALTGVLIGWIFGLFNWVAPVVTSLLLAFYGLVFGAIVGGIAGAINYLLMRGRRNFVSMSSVKPSHFEVLVDNAWVSTARQILHEGHGSTSTSGGTV
jgi:hypothetical protein